MKWNLKNKKKKKMALNLEGNIKDQINKSTSNDYIWTLAINKYNSYGPVFEIYKQFNERTLKT